MAPDFQSRQEAFQAGLKQALGAPMLVLFAGIRERMDGADVPLPFRGTAIAMITASGCTETQRPMRNGWSTWASSCCTATMMPSMN